MRDDLSEAKAWLRGLRVGAGLSQENLAELVGVDRRTILNAESPKAGFPEGLTVLKILRELGALAAHEGVSDAASHSLPGRLAAIAEEAERGRQAVVAALAAIDDRLSRIEEQLNAQAEAGRVHPGQNPS